MSANGRIHLQLDLDLGSEPIEGEVRTADGASHPFLGWLGLTVALESAAGRGQSPYTIQGEDPHVA